MSDWRTYDGIADAYERTCVLRFEEAARRLLTFAGADTAGRILDLGTGTGAVLSARRRTTEATPLLVGCDRSVPMLRIARRRVVSAHFLPADVERLPFADSTFDLVTANCVLSHLQDHQAALIEARRVLRRGGLIAISSWGPASDACSAAWNELLAEAVGGGEARKAVEAVVPTEAFLSDPANVRSALAEAGFDSVRVATRHLAYSGGVADYVAERGLAAGARFARHALGEARWQRFLDQAEANLRHRFGTRITYERPLVIACAAVP